MLGKSKKPTLNDRMTDMESCMDKILDSLETLLDRTERIEEELDSIKAENLRLDSEIVYIKPRLGMPV